MFRVRVNEAVVCGESSGGRIVGYVTELVVVIYRVADAVLAIAGMPDFFVG